MAAPVMTKTNPAGNRLAPTTIPAGGIQTFAVDYSSKIAGLLQVSATFGTVSTVAGLQIDVFRQIGNGLVTDTQSTLPAILVAVGGSTQVRSVALATGRYQVKLTNLDTGNDVTAVQANDDTIDSYS